MTHAAGIAVDLAARSQDSVAFEDKLRRKVIGQDKAITLVSNCLLTHLAGMSAPGRPIATMLFLGPTGTGKTRMVESIADALFGDEHALLKIDCAEFQENHEVAKLIGAPPGYLGHKDTKPRLCQESLDKHHTKERKISLLLLDEIEKAAPAFWNILLGILDKATLTLNDNAVTNFSSTLIFMTSNLGASQMAGIVNGGIGFNHGSGLVGLNLYGRLEQVAVAAARRKFLPEFMNRMDQVVVFRSLDSPDLAAILQIELDTVQKRILTSPTHQKFVFHCDELACKFLLEEGYNRRDGARHLRRTIEKHMVNAFSHLIMTGQVGLGDLLYISARDAHLTFERVPGEAVLGLPEATWSIDLHPAADASAAAN